MSPERTRLRRIFNEASTSLVCLIGGVPFAGQFFVLFLTIGHAILASAEGGLTLGKTCGELKCGRLEYCSSYDHQCRACTEICDQSSKNYQQSVCEAQCQDHLHDIRYQRLTGSESGSQYYEDIEKLEAKVQLLTIIVAAALAISIIVLLILIGALLVWAWRSRQRRRLKQKFEQKFNKAKDQLDISTLPADRAHDGLVLRPTSAASGASSSRSPVRSPTGQMPRMHTNNNTSGVTSRQPSESSAPNIPAPPTRYAYDNPALTPTSGRSVEESV